MRYPAACLVVAACGCSPSETAWFSEEAAERGVDFRHHSGFRERPMLPEIMGGGAALADLDGDDDLDLYLVQSGRVDETLDEALSANRLYLNRGDGHFDEVEGGAGSGDRGYGMGVAAGDYDDDGDIDLYVTNLGPNALLRNDGAGRFTDVTVKAGVGDPGWSTAATFLDLDNDGDLDLFVVNYLNWTLALERDCYATAFHATYCGACGIHALAWPWLISTTMADSTFLRRTARSSRRHHRVATYSQNPIRCFGVGSRPVPSCSARSSPREALNPRLPTPAVASLSVISTAMAVWTWLSSTGTLGRICS